jgi:hypothetical protein
MIGTAHRRRLRALWHSAGWPSQDLIEAELLVAGLIERQSDPAGRETLKLTHAGLRELTDSLTRNRALRDAHEALVARVALAMHRAGRVVWRGLNLRAPLMVSQTLPNGEATLLTRWAQVLPDVFSIRHTTLEDQVSPLVHEIKVRRADLLSDLKRPAKAEAYAALASECWYVLQEGIGEASEIPLAYGVMEASTLGLEVLRPAPRRAHRLPFMTWMALARAQAEVFHDEEAQPGLGAGPTDPV